MSELAEQWQNKRCMNLFAKYDVGIPRYTSYPALPHWTGISEDEWNRRSRECGTNEISLYLHVPYCRTPCAFCGCTRVVTRDRSKAEPFIQAILREADLKLAGHGAKHLAEVHLGGGTPTWLSAAEMESLLVPLLGRFSARTDDFSFSIEVDPRTLTSEHIDAFVRLGVNRVSLGVQDFHEPTLKAIRRDQSFSMVADKVARLRDAGISGINFDLVFGLPLQTEASVQRTIESVIALAPSRIAHYAYAHMPAQRPGQRVLERDGIPVGFDKWTLALTARRALKDAGYHEVGFDHFALPSDSLARAADDGRLHRNFMGYTTARPQLLVGLGPSSLSDCGTAYIQNEKDPAAWMEAVHGRAPLQTRGHALSDDDLERRAVVLDVMCRLRCEVPLRIWNEPHTRQALESLWLDGFIEADWNRASVKATARGRLFLRNIAAVFDPHLRA